MRLTVWVVGLSVWCRYRWKLLSAYGRRRCRPVTGRCSTASSSRTLTVVGCRQRDGRSTAYWYVMYDHTGHGRSTSVVAAVQRRRQLDGCRCCLVARLSGGHERSSVGLVTVVIRRVYCLSVTVGASGTRTASPQKLLSAMMLYDVWTSVVGYVRLSCRRVCRRLLSGFYQICQQLKFNLFVIVIVKFVVYVNGI